MSQINTPSQPINRIFEFNGKGGEYFSIWIVNVVLTILTLGFYSAWATVRTKQYFYGNTKLDGVSFQYLAEPKQILKGRILASLIFVSYYAAALFYPTAAVMILLALLALGPVFLIWSMSFQLRNSAYRHVSFLFQRDYAGAYKTFALPIVLIGGFILVSNLYLPEELKIGDPQTASIASCDAAIDVSYEEGDAPINTSVPAELTEADEGSPMSPELKTYLAIQMLFIFSLIFLTPLWDYFMTRFRVIHSQYGNEPFTFEVNARQFYGVYGRLIIISFLMLVLFAVFASVIMPLLTTSLGAEGNEEKTKATAGSLAGMSILLLIPLYLWFFAYFKAKRTNLIYSHIDLDGMKLRCNMKTGYLMYLYFTNTLAMAVTLGLLMPWAMVRTARYRASVTSVHTSGPIEQFSAAQQKQQSALGEELGNIFDMELGI